MNTLHIGSIFQGRVTLQCQNQLQHNLPTMTSTSSGPTIDLFEDDKVTVVTRWDIVLCKKPSYRIATAFYFCCHYHLRHHHCILLLLLPLPPPPSSTAAVATAVDCHCQLASTSGLTTTTIISHRPPSRPPPPPSLLQQLRV